MKIHIKALIDAKWGSPEFVVFREGEFQNPVAILSLHDLMHLADEIAEARKDAAAAVKKVKG